MNCDDLEARRGDCDFAVKLGLVGNCLGAEYGAEAIPNGGVIMPDAELWAVTGAHSRDFTPKLQARVGKRLLASSGYARARAYAPPAGPAVQSPPSSEERRSGSEERRSGSVESSEETGNEPRGWAPREQQLEALLAFCAGGWRTLPQIAAALGRTDSTVRTMYLRPLLAQGTLERLHPESPRHPMQAYRTARKTP